MGELKIETKVLEKDIVIVGGGTAGCQAAIKAKDLDSSLDVLIVEKTNIERSGCLAAGVNAINAYLNGDLTPQDYVDYVKKESSGLIREDLTYSIGERVNRMAEKLEEYGLVIQKDEDGNYEARGRRSIKINGENIKPILANRVKRSGTEILNKTVATNCIVKNGKVNGIYAFSLENGTFYVIKAKAVICTTGGASGIYRPNNPGAARHKMWYSPFNTGAGYAMGLRAGAEMTTFEMRFIALRTKDTISPTGTIAQGLNSDQVNAHGDTYLDDYENPTTPIRLHATEIENLEGRGPCYLDVSKVTEEKLENLKKAYLSMSPGIILKWTDEDTINSKKGVEITGSEPYIVGGHGQAGYWVDKNRKSTLDGLYAAGDVVGGSPKKYVTGCMAEAEIAVEDIIDKKDKLHICEIDNEDILREKDRVYKPIKNSDNPFLPDEIEAEMQKIMDEYAGGISDFYRLNEEKLLIAKERLKEIESDAKRIGVSDFYNLVKYHEVLDRLLVARAVVEHLLARKETRWRCYQERTDYPRIDNKNWFKYINSKYNSKDDTIEILERSVPYEYKNKYEYLYKL